MELTNTDTETKKGQIAMQRYFSKDGISPYDAVKWTRSNISITDENSNFLFEQKDSEAPEHFSPLARQIVFSRYSYGENGTPERETSLRTIIERVSETYGKWAVQQEYMSQQDADVFRDEIAAIALEQRASFNSPVWFNVGTDRYASRRLTRKGEGFHNKNGSAVKIEPDEAGLYPQTSACFIQSVEDDMDDIMDLAAREARLFKYGSGTGTDLSTLRSMREKLSGGGRPSGPMAYEKFYDKVAEIVKSGGKTRRAAKMNSLRIDHPDILEFIESKQKEEEKARALVKAGYSRREAAETIAYQNVNFSVRVSDDFMRTIEQGGELRTKAVHSHELDEVKNADGSWAIPRYDARKLFEKMAKAAWSCGDPGIQYDDTINKWNTCSNSFRIHASNPCSEYMFVNDSSCNLASVNIMSFRRDNGTFDIESFKRTIKTMVYAMDTNYDNSSFPTERIANNSHKYRPLGLGYANMGAYVMSLGLPYDSDEGRAVAASLTALLNATAYETSAEMAEKLGTFEEYDKNKEPMMKVMEMHRDALQGIDKKKLPAGLENILDDAERTSDEMIRKGRRFGFRNSQATVIAPTGTIGFMMDCDTKGIEPELALVQYKKLAEGGILRMVNQTVSIALKTLNYNPSQIRDMINYLGGYSDIKSTPGLKKEHIEDVKKIRDDPSFDIDKTKKEFENLGYSDKAQEMAFYVKGHETMEGAPHLREEHLSVFDTSFEPAYKQSKNARFIPYTGHLKMMAACQPFVSGAISKTVNMPKEATIEDVSSAYMQGWKMGLKAVAIYRDGSKSWQPANTSKKSLEGKAEIQEPVRRRLPDTRPAVTHHFGIMGGGVQQPDGSIKGVDHEGYFTVGFYPDTGKPGEVFITMAKEGSQVSGLMDWGATLMSMALQFGVPLEAMTEKFTGMKFDPHGLVTRGDKTIRSADSIPDYLHRALDNIAKQYLAENHNNGNSKAENQTSVQSPINGNENNNSDPGEHCPSCNRLTLKKEGGCGKMCGCGYQDFAGCGG